MKKAILYSAMALATTFGMSSCGDDFLLVDPTGSVSEEKLSNDQGIDFVLTGAYASLNGMIGSPWNNPGNSLSNIVFGDVVGADANKGSTAGDQSDWTMLETYTFTAANSYISDKWGAIYEVVKRCNNVISMANNAESISNPDLIIGQAEFIKSLWLFEGIRMYGAAIPYVTVEDYEANVDPQVSNVDESGNYVYIWSKIEADLKDAINKLPADWKSTGEYGRATSWMAKALLAKLYLYWSSPYNGTNGTADHWSDAKSLFKEIIDSGVDAKGTKYKLAETYQSLFDAATSDWSGESVIDCQMTLNGSDVLQNAVYGAYYIGFASGDIPGGGWGFYAPTSEFVNSYIVDAKGLPASNYRDVPALTLTSTYTEVDEWGEEHEKTAVQSDLDTPTDPRLDVNVGRFGVPFLDWGASPTTDWIRSFANAGPYMSKKAQTRRSERGSNALTNYPVSNTKNFHYMRLADVYLMYAECCIHDGDLDTAQEYINKVRERAANAFVAADYSNHGTDEKPVIITKGNYTFDNQVAGKVETNAAANYRLGKYTTPFANADEAWTALKRERRAELGLEGCHWYDVVRWGDHVDFFNKFIAFEQSSTGGQKTKYINGYTKNMVTFPIPQSEIQTAEGRFVQNVNWK